MISDLGPLILGIKGVCSSNSNPVLSGASTVPIEVVPLPGTLFRIKKLF